MKKIVCPKCDNPIFVNELRCTSGSSLFMVCHHCGKNFSITSEMIDELDKEKSGESYGSIVVIENAYCYRQEHPLQLGDNIIGRRSKGTDIQVPIVSGDISMARQHCVIHVKQNKQGELSYTLRDFPSVSGTFLRNECLSKKERVVLNGPAVVTIGATTFIVHQAGEEEDE